MPARPATPEAVLDGLAEGVVLVDEGKVSFVNTAASEILGVDPSWAAGRSLIAVLRDHRLERVWHGREQAELTVQGRLILAVPINGGIALRDSSEAHGARADSRELLAVLSHELRTPMTTVRATLDALHYEDLSSDERRRLLARAVDEADRVVRLLGDLTADVNPQRERSVRMVDMVERAASVLAHTLEERGITVAQAGSPLTVWADPDKVLQVLINLIENAATYGPERSEVQVVCASQEEWGLVMVRDHGDPLPGERFQKLFEPFKRADSAYRPGRGLGLYVVRSIAERWGGRAWGRTWRLKEDQGFVEGNEFGVAIPLGSKL